MDGPVLMVGTALDGQGGVASVVRTWRDAGLFERWKVRYVATNGEGGGLIKAGLALNAWLRCAAQLVVGRVALVHVHTSSYISFWRKTPVFALALLSRRPLIVNLHGGAFREFYAQRGPLGQAWIRLVMRRASGFVVLTHEWRDWAMSIEPRADLRVIPNPAPFLPDLRRASAPREPDLILFLGRIERDKGLFVLLEALAQARERGAMWRLVCGGTGDLAQAQRAATALSLGSRDVQFLGWTDGDEKTRWLERCALLVLPSFVENMPVVLLEAFAFAKPVIATRVGGVPDVVTPGEDGWLVEAGDVVGLADALCVAHTDDDRLLAMGRRARAKAEARYSPAHVVAEVDALYRECAEGAVVERGRT